MQNLYNELYELIQNLVYGGTLDAYGEYVCTLVSTCAVLFLLAIPFIIVWRVIKLVCG